MECLQLLEGNRLIDTTLDRIESHFGMNSWGTDYNIVATLGTPMSGKSTLLNDLFDTDFACSDAYGKTDRTKGVWISKALNENILVMDCEEVTTQKREVAEIDAIIRLVARTADVIIINVTERDIYSFEHIQSILEHITMEHAAFLGNFRKTLIMFALRDHMNTKPVAPIEAMLKCHIQNITYTKSQKTYNLVDYIRVCVVALPHKFLEPVEFSAKIKEIKSRLSNQNGDCIFKLDYWKLVDAHHIDTHIKSIMSTNADQYLRDCCEYNVEPCNICPGSNWVCNKCKEPLKYCSTCKRIASRCEPCKIIYNHLRCSTNHPRNPVELNLIIRIENLFDHQHAYKEKVITSIKKELTQRLAGLEKELDAGHAPKDFRIKIDTIYEEIMAYTRRQASVYGRYSKSEWIELLNILGHIEDMTLRYINNLRGIAIKGFQLDVSNKLKSVDFDWYKMKQSLCEMRMITLKEFEKQEKEAYPKCLKKKPESIAAALSEELVDTLLRSYMEYAEAHATDKFKWAVDKTQRAASTSERANGNNERLVYNVVDQSLDHSVETESQSMTTLDGSESIRTVLEQSTDSLAQALNMPMSYIDKSKQMDGEFSQTTDALQHNSSEHDMLEQHSKAMIMQLRQTIGELVHVVNTLTQAIDKSEQMSSETKSAQT